MFYICILYINIALSRGNVLSEGESKWVADSISLKDDAVRKFDPKLIILCGSNGLFGFSAKRLTLVHGVKSVNSSVHAGLGIDYTLHYGSRYFKSGRVIVLPLEYEQYEGPSGGSIYSHQVLNYDDRYLEELSFINQLEFMARIPITAHFNMFKNMFSRSSVLNTVRTYGTSNEYGDALYNYWNEKERDQRVENLSKVLRSNKVFSHSEHSWYMIHQFVLKAQEKNTEIVLAHPNLFIHSFNKKNNEKFIEDLKSRAAEINLKVIGNFDDRLFDETRLYDTKYHQNIHGQMLSTDELYRQLVVAGIDLAKD